MYMKTKIFILSCLFLGILGFGQQNYWTLSRDASKTGVKFRKTQPALYKLYNLNLEKIKTDLATVPQRFSADQSHEFIFPDADGNFRTYIVQEASVMEPELQAKYPEIRSYVGWEKGNSGNSIRFSVTPNNGMNVMYFDGWNISYLDSYSIDNSQYIIYKRKDIHKDAADFVCGVDESNSFEDEGRLAQTPLVSDGQFRTYRLALAGTGEYTVFQGGTVAKALDAMATTMTRVNGVYEKTASLTMVMIANNDLLVYTNGSTDPYTNGNANLMINENQTNVTAVIGSANYDIGHVFGTNSGGLAGLGVVCLTNSKARGVTGSGAPVGDPFDIDYVAHEMGHQFGANHTFNGTTSNCGGGNRNLPTAYEPGSGSTIMAYAGICGADNVQTHSDAYFHRASVKEINTVIIRTNDCSVKVPNNNGVPVANAGSDYTIPKGTPFVLTGTSTDPDNDPVTYLWEQYDNQNSTQPPVSTSTVGPAFRSYFPSESPSRYFPKMSYILANNLAYKWEMVPTVARTMKFSLLVNDNRATGNQNSADDMVVTVADSGPFKVTSHTTNIEYDAAVPTTVTWDVAGTNAAPVNTQNVTILLSKSGGGFDTVLAASVPNNGSASVYLPNENISNARLMVKAVDNIYFAVNSSKFSIKKGVMATSEASVKNFSIYPNPAKNEVNISLKNTSESGQYFIYDTSGRIVKKGDFTGNETIKTDHLTNGNYIIKLQTKNGSTYSDKLIIKK